MSAAADTGSSPFTDFRGEAPGKIHKITPGDLPKPYMTPDSDNDPRVVTSPRTRGRRHCQVSKWSFTRGPQESQIDPDGAERRLVPSGERSRDASLYFAAIASDGKAAKKETFATGLSRPFGIAFYPPGPNPQYVYIGNTDSVVRFPYQNGDLKARGPQETIIPSLPSGNERVGGGGHWTRDIAFSLDGKQMFVSVGSRTNIADVDEDKTEFHRANILVANPDGSNLRVYASGIRNPVGIAIDPKTGVLWTSVNERDRIGDNLPPDYITHVQEGGFYGWPWYYTGGNEDPRLKGKHPELKDKVIVPDVLLEPHNASLELTFYEGNQFPAEYAGDIFAAEHGSWNRSVRTGYEVILVPLHNGRATGEYEDFLTGFVTAEGKGVGPSRRRRRGARRLVDGDRRRLGFSLAGQLCQQMRERAWALAFERSRGSHSQVRF